MPMAVEVVAITHRGAVRARNEDTIAVGSWIGSGAAEPPRRFIFDAAPAVAIVCDGLGGHRAGDVASRIAAEALARAAADGATGAAGPPGAEAVARAERWLVEANDAIYARMVADPSLATMGSTAAGLAALGEELVVFNVGDSRVYRWQDGYLCQLSLDDSIIGRPDRPLSQCLGGREAHGAIVPHARLERWIPGRRYLVCSDGLYGVLGLEAMEAALAGPPADAAARLLEGALAAGAPDNVSIVILARDGGEAGRPGR